MPTIRVSKPDRERFEIVDKRLLEDPRLSFAAKGLLVYLLSKPDGWHVRSESLGSPSVGPNRRDAVRSMMQELVTCGYMVRVKGQNTKGQWSTEVIVYERPPAGPTATAFGAHRGPEDPASEFPASASRTSDDRPSAPPTPGVPALSTEDGEVKTESEEGLTPASVALITSEGHCRTQAETVVDGFLADVRRSSRPRPLASTKKIRELAGQALEAGHSTAEVCAALDDCLTHGAFTSASLQIGLSRARSDQRSPRVLGRGGAAQALLSLAEMREELR